MDVSDKVAAAVHGDDQVHHAPKSQPTTPSSRSRSLSVKNNAAGHESDDHQHPHFRNGVGGEGKENANEDYRCLDLLCEELDRFLSSVPSTGNSEIPESVDAFIDGLARKITAYDSRAEKFDWYHDSGRFLSLVKRFNSLIQTLSSSDSSIVGKAGLVLQQAMAFMGDEFRSILAEPSVSGNGEKESGRYGRNKSLNSTPHDCCVLRNVPQSPTVDDSSPSEPYPPETLAILSEISKVMIDSGYEKECRLAYSVARKSSLDEIVSEKLCLDRISIEEVLKMNWDTLESEIVKWLKAFKRCLNVYLTGEMCLCNSVLPESDSASRLVFFDVSRAVILRTTNFAQAISMGRRSTERLFKLLDMYEAFRDSRPVMDQLFSGDLFEDIRYEIDSARTQLAEAAVGVFSELENSIRCDSAKTPVPGGAVHPLTRYVMNYLKLACEYKDTLQQVFETCRPKRDGGDESRTALSVQVLGVMDLLDHNLDAKSKLYKDPSLSYIFFMNNGRYIVQKVKNSEIYNLLGDDWYRKRSSDLRQYHKNYQRETWGKVLSCFKDEGLYTGGGGFGGRGGGGGGGGGGNVSKSVLKERFKMFNTMFEEIHRNQSCWIVSDEQLQSELRVSISAVIIPAYRSFLGRFRQYLESGRQGDKYIRYGPEDLETFIDELFEGTPASMIKRKA